MVTEGAAKIADIVTAELVECAPAPEAPTTDVLPQAPDASPTQKAAQATIEQTGADPPPLSDRTYSTLPDHLFGSSFLLLHRPFSFHSKGLTHGHQ